MYKFILIFLFFYIVPCISQTVYGTVSNVKTKKPVNYAYINLIGTNIEKVSDESGKYKIVNIPIGDQVIVTKAFGYINDTLHVHISEKKDYKFDINLTIRPSFPNSTLYKDYHKKISNAFERDKSIITLKVEDHRIEYDHVYFMFSITNNYMDSILINPFAIYCELYDSDFYKMGENTVISFGDKKVPEIYCHESDVIKLGINESFVGELRAYNYSLSYYNERIFNFRLVYGFDINEPINMETDPASYYDNETLSMIEKYYCKILRIPLKSDYYKIIID